MDSYVIHLAYILLSSPLDSEASRHLIPIHSAIPVRSVASLNP